MNPVKRYYSAVFALLIGAYLVINDNLKENEKNVYRKSKMKSDIHFTKTDVNLNMRHILNYQAPEREADNFKEGLIYSAMPNAFTVTDLNRDELPDLCYVTPDFAKGLSCYVNVNGKSFEDVTEKMGLIVTRKNLPSAVYSADFNNDGASDLLVVSFGKHIMLLQEKGKFREVENEWFSNGDGANFHDFNNDGLLDVVFANYYQRNDLAISALQWNFSGTADRGNGDHNEIWLNKGNGRFELAKDMLPSIYKEHTTTVGIADYDRDGNTEVFVGNDFSTDHMYSFDRSSQKLTEVTDSMISPELHSFSSMNSEAVDLNKDGYLDLFNSVLVIPPLLGWSNSVFIFDPGKKQFQQKAVEMGLDRCGYAWTAKAADFNLDGTDEIIVASGFHTAGNGKLNALFYRLVRSATPKWFPATYPKLNVEDYSIGMKPSPCVFYKSGDTFHDISESTLEWDKSKASRSLIVVDINNDGKTDVIIPEHDGVVRTFINDSPVSNHWVGLKFKSKSGSYLNFGVKAEVFGHDGKSLQYFEFNPANGYKTQSDYRKVIGLGGSTVAEIKIYSPGSERTVKLTADKYNEIEL
ncbi:MAG: ASPIC/UnbV domain protein [Pseudobdellovibrio sp.]|jgi:hypothetical protein|nr:ASPIC/UnbV domain protein [Pseudobdellovibrio sp.]